MDTKEYIEKSRTEINKKISDLEELFRVVKSLVELPIEESRNNFIKTLLDEIEKKSDLLEKELKEKCNKINYLIHTN